MRNFQSFFPFQFFPSQKDGNFFLNFKNLRIVGVGKDLKDHPDPTPCLLFLSLSTFFSFQNPGLCSSCSYFIPSAFLMFFLLSSFHLLLWFFPFVEGIGIWRIEFWGLQGSLVFPQYPISFQPAPVGAHIPPWQSWNVLEHFLLVKFCELEPKAALFPSESSAGYSWNQNHLLFPNYGFPSENNLWTHPKKAPGKCWLSTSDRGNSGLLNKKIQLENISQHLAEFLSESPAPLMSIMSLPLVPGLWEFPKNVGFAAGVRCHPLGTLPGHPSDATVTLHSPRVLYDWWKCPK